jgi:hypothetical protein
MEKYFPVHPSSIIPHGAFMTIGSLCIHKWMWYYLVGIWKFLILIVWEVDISGFKKYIFFIFFQCEKWVYDERSICPKPKINKIGDFKKLFPRFQTMYTKSYILSSPIPQTKERIIHESQWVFTICIKFLHCLCNWEDRFHSLVMVALVTIP